MIVGADHPVGWPGVGIISTEPEEKQRTLPGVGMNAEGISEDPFPPNTAPVAVDDAVTTDEDTPVVIDVLANDTDADGDTLSIDDWEFDPPNGSVSLEADGMLKYTPNPDFYGTETFDYTVTDGREPDSVGASVTATVTVTVNPVNDAPVTFDDGQVFINSYDSPPPDPNQLVYIYSAGDFSLLSNDIDYDGSVAKVAEVDTTGTVGRVTVFDNGFATWEVPWDFVGSTTFKYRAIDDQGAESDWATVRFWSDRRPYEDGPPVDPNTDDYYYADDPIQPSQSVLENDSGGAMAFLVNHPSSGRLTSFGTDGTFRYEPGLDRPDMSFDYRVCSANGEVWTSATVNLNAVNMDIYDGQGGTTPLREQDEKEFGAITVANLNDTDADQVRDSEDRVVKRDTNPSGEDEKDLMKLVVRQPKGQQGAVTLSSDSYVRFYNNSNGDVNGIYGDPAVLQPAAFIGNEGSKFAIVWAEALEPSASVADITISMTYGGATEEVKATAIWSELTNFRATGQQGSLVQGLPQTKETKDYLTNFDRLTNNTRKLGTDMPALTRIRAGNPFWAFANAVEMEFTLAPAGVEKLKSRVRFDVSRSVETKRVIKKNDGTLPVNETRPLPQNYNLEMSNDDAGTEDEVNTPTNGKLYSSDFPTQFLLQAIGDDHSEVAMQMNGFEFVRVLIGKGKQFNHASTQVQGSRASELWDWHSWLLFRRTGPGTWSRPLDAAGQVDKLYNEVDRGRKPLPP